MGGGKSLRAPVQDDDDDDDDDDDEDEEDQLMTAAAPDDEEDDEEPVKKEDTSDAVEKPKVDEAKAEEKDDDGVDDMELESDDDDDDEEEFQPEPEKKQPGRPGLRTAATEDDMEESDDESSEEEFDMDMENLDLNQLIKGEEDRKYLESLPEIEREAILAERFEERKNAFDMKRALRETRKKKREEEGRALGPKGKKQKASKKSKEGDTSKDEELAQSLSSSRRSSTRDRDATKKKDSKAKALAALREERKKIVVKESESESDFPDDDDDEDSDDDYEEVGALKPWQKKAQEEKKKKTTRKSQLDEYEDEEEEEVMETSRKTSSKVVKPAELEEYKLVTLSRTRLKMWCNEPYFQKAVVNGFVKLFVGENEDMKRCYRLCRVIAVERAKQPYKLPKANKKEKLVMTDKMLKLDFAGMIKVFTLSLVSDNKVDQGDVNLYETRMKTARKEDELLGKIEAMKLRRKRNELIDNFTYTTEDIEKKLREKKKKGESSQNLGLEQSRAANAVLAAVGAVDNAKARFEDARGGAEMNDAKEEVKIAEEHLEMRLEQERMVLKKVKSRRKRNQNRSKNWVEVNERANKMNKLADVGLSKPKSIVSDKGPSGQESFNPYARRKVKPKNLWQVGQGDDDIKKEQKSEAPKSKDNLNTNNHSTPPLVQEQQGKATALSQSHQFVIDVEKMAQTSFLSGIRGLASKKKSKKRIRKGLSLAEYQERKAAGTL